MSSPSRDPAWLDRAKILSTEISLGAKVNKCKSRYFFCLPFFVSSPLPDIMTDALSQLKDIFTCSDEVLRQRLEAYDYNVERAIESMCNDPPNVQQDVVTFGCLGKGTVNVNTPRTSITSAPQANIHPDVSNGDCVFFCLYLILSQVISFSSDLNVFSPKDLAAIVRTPIIQFIEDNWFSNSLVSDMPWWQIIKMTHHEGIPDWEREKYNGDWGTTAEEGLAGWKNVRDEFYGSEAEMTAFVELMWQKYGIPIAIRVWRKNGSDELDRSSTIHCPCVDVNALYVGDILHTGRLDSNRAHCQLMRSGSFQAPIPIPEKDEKKSTRTRRKIDDDPDYEPPTERKKKKK
jgi:hypothetical protein